MTKTFNITGTCIPERHFMADISGKLDEILEMISRGDYFTINRPRQYGKTTVIYSLEQRLRKDNNYLAIDISFEGIDTPTYEKQERFIPTILNILNRRLKFMKERELAAMIEANNKITDFDGLNAFFTDLIMESGRKVVLLIDEVDKSANNQLFLDFLGMLRAKYLKRNEGKDYSFFSVILAGVHDIKTLKAKIRPDEKRTYNSPWNIAVDFEVELSLSPGEITPMLEDYTAERKVKMDIPSFAKYLHYFTSGYPFLVSYLCKIIDEKILPHKKHKTWKTKDLVDAFKIAITEDNTNFDALIKNLENNPDLYEFVFKIIINGNYFSYNPHNLLIRMGKTYGILKREQGRTIIHNRVYEQFLYNHIYSRLKNPDENRVEMGRKDIFTAWL